VEVSATVMWVLERIEIQEQLLEVQVEVEVQVHIHHLVLTVL
jgi:hypothetical protein